ncbi:MAG: hypothetical protein Q8L87_17670, partial [Anaerolineales bacterium]|nr:hypothetical protein [Anaerolineales bacterium]
MQTNKTQWPVVLVLIVLALGVLFLLLLALIVGVGSLIGLFTGINTVGEMIAAFAFGFDAMLLIACVWFVYQKAAGREQADLPLSFPFAWWQVLAGVGVVFFSVLAGGVAAATGIAWLGWMILPILTLFVILTPIWIVFGIGSNGLDAGPRWQFFAILGLSMTVAPVLMIVLELITLVALVVGGIVLLASSQPGLVMEFSNSMQRLLEQPGNQELILQVLTPYIANPVVIATGIGYIAIIVPLIEELLKPLAVWLFAGKLTSPMQGFVLGMLSGAAFSVFESLNASADGSTAWVVIVSARAGTGILHMLT